MSIPEPYPSLDEVLESIGEAGRRLAEIEASEGAAGNISVCLGWPVEVRRQFPLEESLPLPVSVPALAGRTLLVTGSGRRLRDIHRDPQANLAVVMIAADGQTAQQYLSPRRLFGKITTEFNSHLAVHQDQVERSGTNFHAMLHAQPPYITYLSHIARYRDQATLNQRLLSWQPETIVNLPEGIGVLPFIVPGSQELMQANVESLRTHRIVVWSKHGVMARSDISATRASDRIEYAETAARYEYLNLQSGELADRLSVEEIQRICHSLDIQQSIF